MARRVVRIAVVVLLLGAGAIGVRAAQVHAETGEWRLSPSATPPVLHVLGRDYRRSGPSAGPGPEALDVRIVGRTAGGALIYVPPTTVRAVPTVLHVFAGQEDWTYELVGGP